MFDCFCIRVIIIDTYRSTDHTYIGLTINYPLWMLCSAALCVSLGSVMGSSGARHQGSKTRDPSAGHLLDTSRTPAGNLPDTSESPPGHLRVTSRTPPGHLRFTPRTPPSHLPDCVRVGVGTESGIVGNTTTYLQTCNSAPLVTQSCNKTAHN